MNGLRKLAFSALLCTGITVNAAFADVLLIKSNTSIGAADYQHDGKSLIVEGATLTLSGTHSFESIVLRNSAVLTTPVQTALSLTADTVDVDASSRIDLSDKGKNGSAGKSYAGGSYGGPGGAYSTNSSNAPYGDFREPKDFGSGGRNAYSAYSLGGGALELTTGTLTLNGVIRSNGQTLSGYGSGSGGSLLLRVGALALGETAQIEANGGGSSSNSSFFGGGGGGRVAVYYATLSSGSLAAQVSAKGGKTARTDTEPGAAGSIYLKSTGSGAEQVVFDNTGIPLTAKPALLDLSTGPSYSGNVLWSNVVGQVVASDTGGVDAQLVVDGATLMLSGQHTYKSVTLRNSAVLTTPVEVALSLTADTVDVDATSRIDVTGKGALPSLLVGSYCGGSHGGLGGIYSSGSVNPVFGDVQMPVTFGLGGKGSSSSSDVRGGGALTLVTRLLTLNGQLLANGATTTAGNVGGGAGGSLWLTVQKLIGGSTTRIQARGSDGKGIGGAGGGGRIALYYGDLQGVDVGQISVSAGTLGAVGGVGTLHMEFRAGSTAVVGSNLVDVSNQNIQQFSLNFINAVDPASINPANVSLRSPDGIVPITTITAVNFAQYLFTLESELADGAYELRVSGIRSAQGRGMDQNGNGIEDEADDVFVRSFVVDRLPPTAPVITSPLVTPAINALTARKVTISGEREAQTAILVNGVPQVALGDGAWTVTNYALAEGASDLQIQSRDVAGNLSAASVIKFSVDSIPPGIQQWAPAGPIKEVPTSVWVRFSETGSGLDFASSSLTLKRGADSISGQLSLDGDVLRLTPNSILLEGAYSFAVVLQDKAGNQRANTYSFTLDYTAPVAPVVNAYPALTTNKQLLVSGTKENGSHVRVFNAANTLLTSICCSGTTWQHSLVLEPGDNHFTVTQTDAAGNVSPATAVQVRFDNEAPGPVVFTLDPKGSGTEVKLAWPSYDEAANGNDIQQYRIYSALQPFNAVDQAQVLMSVSGGSKQALVKNLTRNEERYFAVVAVDQQGLLLNTVTAQAATPEDVQAPAEPLALAVSSGATQLNLSWQASPNAAGDLAGYALYVGENNAQRIELPLSALSEGLRYSLTGLE
ncbi:MAG: Ig-like domain-containing protein, partial [Pseudomonas sp.]|nr:Ig-like domain-containing protein [Pseudomonas sp.]